MSKSRQTFGKKNREQEQQKRRKEKAQRKEDRKATSNKGKGMEGMIAYVNEYGQLSSTPPDPTRKNTIKAHDIEISIPKQEPMDPADLIHSGTLTFFNQSKGYGFIKDLNSKESFFVHINAMTDQINENDKVTFEVEMGNKGPVAVKVRKA